MKFILFLLLFTAGNVFAVNYYVSLSGDNDNDGLSPSGAFATCSRAVSVVNPGDSVFFADGTYDSQNFHITRSGTADAWITFKSTNKWGARITVSNGGQAISIGSSSAPDVCYIIIDGFEVSADHVFGCGVVSGHGAHHITVRNCWAHHCGQSGFQLNDGDYRVAENNVCNNNGHVTPPEGSGISLWGRKPFDTNPGWHDIVRGNICYNNFNSTSGPNSDGNGVIIDDFRNIQDGHTAGTKDINYTDGEVLIENNLFYNNGGAGIQMFISNNITCRNNTCYMNQQRRTDDWWRGNISASCCANVQIYNNISVTSTNLRMDGGSTDNEGFSHNTALGAYGNASGDQYCANYVYYNNITYDLNDPTSASIGMENISPAIEGVNGNLVATNPLFANPDADFRLQASSPAVNAGTSAYGFPAIDLDGLARPQGPAVDIGCYEYGSTAVALPPARSEFSIQIQPNPVFNGNVILSRPGSERDLVSIYSLTGALLYKGKVEGSGKIP
jgi:hypothetical protein